MKYFAKNNGLREKIRNFAGAKTNNNRKETV